MDLAGSIVVIEQADPGFDWIFSKGIAGLITLYGGANSHIIIRSAEFGITAAIGVGANLYNRIKQSKISNWIQLISKSRHCHEIRIGITQRLMRTVDGEEGRTLTFNGLVFMGFGIFSSTVE